MKFYKHLTREVPQPTNPKKLAEWTEIQDKLKSLLSMITNPVPRSIFEADPTKRAHERYKMLKAEQTSQSVTNISVLYRKVFDETCSNAV